MSIGAAASDLFAVAQANISANPIATLCDRCNMLCSRWNSIASGLMRLTRAQALRVFIDRRGLPAEVDLPDSAGVQRIIREVSKAASAVIGRVACPRSRQHAHAEQPCSTASVGMLCFARAWHPHLLLRAISG